MNLPTLEAYIGDTPLVRLQRDTSNSLLVKLESNNPFGSVKIRPAIGMICHGGRMVLIMPEHMITE